MHVLSQRAPHLLILKYLSLLLGEVAWLWLASTHLGRAVLGSPLAQNETGRLLGGVQSPGIICVFLNQEGGCGRRKTPLSSALNKKKIKKITPLPLAPTHQLRDRLKR